MSEDRLKKLESKSIYIMREANAKYGRLGILWSGGKDSTILVHMAKQALEIDTVPIILLNTDYLFKETLGYMSVLGSKWDLHWYPVSSDGEEFTHPWNDKFKCCTQRKTEVLKTALKLYGVDAVVVGIRRDEQAIRNKERFFSPRQTDGSWDYFNQPLEMQGWDLFVEEINDGEHMRVHPLLEWDEVDVWKYIKKYDIPVNPLYFTKDGKRMRSIGCSPCTTFIDSEADTVNKIIEELKEIGGSERDGRTQDKEADMGRLRALGYL